jgi:hypothetical protein
MKKGRRYGEIAQRCGAEFVAVGAVAGPLLPSEIFVLSRTREDDVPVAGAESRRDLRHADDVLLEVAEHLVRMTIDLVTLEAFVVVYFLADIMTFRAFTHPFETRVCL